MTLKSVKVELKKVGMTISKRDDEYRVNFVGEKEATAYYTSDLEDARDTGLAMANNKTKLNDPYYLTYGENI